MLERIIGFFHILRHLGLRISSGEAVNAVEGLQVINLADPEAVETVFLATLAKSTEEQMIIQKAFRAYFVTPEAEKARNERRLYQKQQEDMQMEAAEGELSYILEGPPGEGEQQVSLPISDEEKRVYINLPEEKKKRIQEYLNRAFQRNPVNNPEPLITKMISSSLNTWKYQMGLEGNDVSDFLKPVPTGSAEADQVMEEVLSEVKEEKNLLYQDIRNITEADSARAMGIVRKMARRLATRMSRRYKGSGKKERPDLRRTVRHNIRYGGMLLELKYKTRKVSRPRLMIVCDVSGSMARYAGFVLHFIYGLAGILDKIDCFVFSENLARINLSQFSGKPLDKTMAEVINDSDIWGRGTDIGLALTKIMGEHKNSLSKETFVIIVSDTRTVNPQFAEGALKALRVKVRDIIWLNPLPEALWEKAGGTLAFSRHSRMFECSTLARLNRVITDQVFI